MDPQQLLFGRDDTPGIVSVHADRSGRALVWRRVGLQVHREERRFLNWFLVRDPAFLADLPVARLEPADLSHGLPALPTGLGLVRLAGNHPMRYLVLTDRLSELEPTLVAAHNKRTGEQARNLATLRAEVYWRPPPEQYLMLSGRTYFKHMSYTDLRRLQFDLETTGLDDARDRIFMINLCDSTGFRVCLDTGSMTERELLEAFARLVRERDPDVLENHNLFGFDIPFLIRRAAALGVPLPLGRDGGTFTRTSDQVKVGERSDGFTRYSLVGREIIDTLHAVRRYGAIVRDMRYHGLKDAARYFGFARLDREYVPGPEIWSTFQVDPERVRRYGADDVIEVEELSRILLASAFALSSMVPKPYERVATAGTGQGLIEPLMVRAYLAGFHSLPTTQRGGGTFEGGRTELFTTGVVSRVVKVDVASLYPSLMLHYRISPRADQLGVFLELLQGLTRLRLQHKAEARRHPLGASQRIYHDALQGAMKQLINSFYGSLGASFSLFADRDAAAEVTRRGREILGRLLAELERPGIRLIEADTDGVFFSVPPEWSVDDEHRLVAELGRILPPGIQVEHDGRYRAMYSYTEKNYVLQDYQGGLRIVGGAFRSSKSDRYTERFLAEAVGRLLDGEPAAIREIYRQYVARLRRREVSIADLCVTVTLNKSPEQYRRAKRREEQYEALLGSGRTDWRPGQRVRYYHALGGRKRLLDEHQNDYDPEYYAARLRAAGLQRLAHALSAPDLDVLLSEHPRLLEPDLTQIRTLTSHTGNTIPYPVGRRSG